MKILILSALVSLSWLQDPASQRLVLKESNEAIEVLRNQPYYTRNDEELLFDVYRPRDLAENERRPLVLLMNASGPALKDWAQYADWGRAFAARGLVAVTFQARRERTTDFDDLLVHLTEQADELRLEPQRTAAWACSANARSVVPWVMKADEEVMRCAVFYYGVLSPESIRTDLPVLVVRAGRDEPAINDSIDAFVSASLRANAPLTLINYATGQHGFDVRDDTEESRRIIRETIDFVSAQLR